MTTSAQKRLAAQRAAAARERIKKAQRRRRLYLVGGPLLVVVLIVAVLIVVRIATGSGQKSGQKATTANPAVVTKVTNVPASVLDNVGVGKVLATPRKITAPALTANGKPEVIYIGAEFCPYCAAERWAFAVAMSRFGAFHNLGQTTSSPTDSPPSLATLTFHGATYTSKYVTLVAKELQSNQVVNGSYARLDTLTSSEQALATKYDAPPYVASSGIPFIDFGGKYVLSGATYDNTVLIGKTHLQIADALSDPTSTVGQSIDGAANALTAGVCTLTGQQPSSVCSSAGVTAAAKTLPGGSGTGPGTSQSPSG